VNRTVYTTENPTTAIHTDIDCTQMRSGRDQWDLDCWDDICTHRHPRPRRILEVTFAEALGMSRHKWPCAYCMPGSAAALATSPCEDDFGHQPYEYDGAVICRTCYIPHKGHREVVYWPCTSAYVLGLVPRTLEDAA
jgi:hypothetical protein